MPDIVPLAMIVPLFVIDPLFVIVPVPVIVTDAPSLTINVLPAGTTKLDVTTQSP